MFRYVQISEIFSHFQPEKLPLKSIETLEIKTETGCKRLSDHQSLQRSQILDPTCRLEVLAMTAGQGGL